MFFKCLQKLPQHLSFSQVKWTQQNSFGPMDHQQVGLLSLTAMLDWNEGHFVPTCMLTFNIPSEITYRLLKLLSTLSYAVHVILFLRRLNNSSLGEE